MLFRYSGSINGSVETEDYPIQKEKPDELQPVITRDPRKTSPQQEAIRTYLNSRNINVVQGINGINVVQDDDDASGSDSR